MKPKVKAKYEFALTLVQGMIGLIFVIIIIFIVKQYL